MTNSNWFTKLKLKINSLKNKKLFLKLKYYLIGNDFWRWRLWIFTCFLAGLIASFYTIIYFSINFQIGFILSGIMGLSAIGISYGIFFKFLHDWLHAHLNQAIIWGYPEYFEILNVLIFLQIKTDLANLNQNILDTNDAFKISKISQLHNNLMFLQYLDKLQSNKRDFFIKKHGPFTLNQKINLTNLTKIDAEFYQSICQNKIIVNKRNFLNTWIEAVYTEEHLTITRLSDWAKSIVMDYKKSNEVFNEICFFLSGYIRYISSAISKLKFVIPFYSDWMKYLLDYRMKFYSSTLEDHHITKKFPMLYKKKLKREVFIRVTSILFSKLIRADMEMKKLEKLLLSDFPLWRTNAPTTITIVKAEIKKQIEKLDKINTNISEICDKTEYAKKFKVLSTY